MIKVENGLNTIKIDATEVKKCVFDSVDYHLYFVNKNNDQLQHNATYRWKIKPYDIENVIITLMDIQQQIHSILEKCTSYIMSLTMKFKRNDGTQYEIKLLENVELRDPAQMTLCISAR